MFSSLDATGRLSYTCLWVGGDANKTEREKMLNYDKFFDPIEYDRMKYRTVKLICKSQHYRVVIGSITLA